MGRYFFGEKKGFTVVEIVIALMILTVVGVMTAIIFRSTQQSFTNAKAFQHVIDLARQSVVRIQNELKATFIDSSGLVAFVGVDSGDSKVKGDSFSLEDEIFFIAPSKGMESGSLAEFGYWQDSSRGYLMRHFESPADFNFFTPDVSADKQLGLVISDLDFKYFDGDVYFDSWDSRSGEHRGKFPKAVSFSFNVGDESNLIKRKFESTVKIASSGR